MGTRRGLSTAVRTVTRCALLAARLVSLYPADAQLTLPRERPSPGLRRLTPGAVRGSCDSALDLDGADKAFRLLRPTSSGRSVQSVFTVHVSQLLCCDPWKLPVELLIVALELLWIHFFHVPLVLTRTQACPAHEVPVFCV